MGIVNATPDSFHSPSRALAQGARSVAPMAEAMIADGVDIIDIGACSTRPGSTPVDAGEELRRAVSAIGEVRRVSAQAVISIDTFRAEVARAAIEAGADIVNDISGGLADSDMIPTVAALKAPYILTHMRGDQSTMQSLTDYPDGVTAGVIAELSHRLEAAYAAGVRDVIIDPGFGFAKTLEQNYELLRNLDLIAEAFGLPVLAGMSRKSMLTRGLSVDTSDALEATVAANTIALLKGASILRVHDVKAAVHAVKVYLLTNNQKHESWTALD